MDEHWDDLAGFLSLWSKRGKKITEASTSKVQQAPTKGVSQYTHLPPVTLTPISMVEIDVGATQAARKILFSTDSATNAQAEPRRNNYKPLIKVNTQEQVVQVEHVNKKGKDKVPSTEEEVTNHVQMASILQSLSELGFVEASTDKSLFEGDNYITHKEFNTWPPELQDSLKVIFVSQFWGTLGIHGPNKSAIDMTDHLKDVLVRLHFLKLCQRRNKSYIPRRLSYIDSTSSQAFYE
ncbi:hypothetical protein RND71_015511 [Anisodus tanguticus]|uniref:Uncharacterized protein n=1 Tax=Anisodus tanguticus TaxID=243964 RepID=A0AAE1S5S8_9SOLA|nr:hypothetical protein RND71_015511 [Anisodus tanguticus]